MNNSLLHSCGTYIDLILRSLRRWPDNIALVDKNNELSYQQLEQRIMSYAATLATLGLKKGDGLAQLASNRADAFVVMAAALLHGIKYTPLHPLGSLEDQIYILVDADINALVIDVPVFAERGVALAERSEVDHVLTLGPADFGSDLTELAKGQSSDAILPAAQADDIAWVSYTGGTTGQPKGVMMSHQCMASTALISLGEWQWPENIRYLASSPISHAAGFLLAPTFLTGGTSYLIPGFEPNLFLDMVEKYKVNTVFCVPTMLYVLMDSPRTQEVDTSCLETIIYASAPMSPTRLKEALEMFGPIFYQCYGQTESIHLSTLRKEDHDLSKPERLASCGRPPAGMTMELLDEDGKVVAQGQVGEVCVRGPSVMNGYLNKPIETAEALKGDWLHTGDLAYRDEEGFYYLVDRAKDMIISGGFNVYPKEIEDVLTAHPAVSLAAVIGIPDEKWGEAVMAVVVLKEGADVEKDELIALVKDKKGAVQAPKKVEFVDQLPLTGLGKLDKKELRAQYWGDQTRMVN